MTTIGSLRSPSFIALLVGMAIPPLVLHEMGSRYPNMIYRTEDERSLRKLQKDLDMFNGRLATLESVVSGKPKFH
ncbi:putative membrane protein [Ogataea parapolymorpha DL-1]|uniref:Membrane protein n=1 Tax=Ogataea parapolymorpha (strain ATCC 26012 / BCRC 20466 / JCM 22074 / NRRL Y-7560 / DL-1) TaxID=871575 RepID=W1QF99_OGAPD|nr:putative membrane protein [Ogataea parapolymorpha DL-1]ESW99687.1 putative membrane protein [Ogataea parapolymorpha DL-1]